MLKKIKKKSLDKDKKAKKKVGSNERETAFYEQQIIDNNQILARLKTRNDYLEKEVEHLKDKLTRLEEDRFNVIAHLKQKLYYKNEEARELGEHLLAIEELRKEEQLAYAMKEHAMKLEYHNMETNLNAEVKLVTGKLNALDDWRNARIELTKKFEIQEEEIAKQNECHARTLYQAEKSLVIGKSNMQKEIGQHLNELAINFQKATKMRIADVTQRAIRENIILNTEYDGALKTCQKLSDKMKNVKNRETNVRLYNSLFRNATDT